MDLAWHQFRKDMRQFRVFLGIWGGLLLLDLAVNLGWVGQVDFRALGGVDQMSNFWTWLLPEVLWVLVGLLPSLAVLADSPARREGFLATRPLAKRDWFFAKLLFVLGLVVAPWVLQELVHLLWQGMPAWVIAQGTLERLLFTLPVAVGFGAFAALWPGYARWARALAGSVVGAYLLLAIVAMVSQFVFHTQPFSFEPDSARGLVGTYGLTLALVLLAVWHSRVHPGVLGRWGGLVLALLCYWVALKLCPRGLLALRPADPTTARTVMADAGFEIPGRGLAFWKQLDPRRPGWAQFVVNLTPRTKPLPAGLLVEWANQDSSVARAGGGTLPGDGRVGHKRLFNAMLWNPSHHSDDIAAWAAEFPEDVLFRMETPFMPGSRDSFQAGRFDLPARTEELAEPLTLRTAFEARVFRWRKLADLPLTPGATATDEFGSWQYLATESLPWTGAQFHVRRRQIELATARDSRCSTADFGPANRFVFMIYDPQRHLVWLPHFFGSSATRATHTALAQHHVALHLPSNSQLTAAEIARCRLLVFEKTWLGTVPETWQSPAFTLADFFLTSPSLGFANNDRLPRAEFKRRLAALRSPAPDAPRREVSLYLLEFLRLVDAHGRPLELRDPLTAELARFVPTHLDVLLDGLPAMSWVSKRSVVNALQRGATEAQKPALVAALAREPELAEVLLARGWVDDARAEVLQLARAPHVRSLPLSALRAIAWIRDPQTYPRLLEEFERQPDEPKLELLRTLPGLEVPLRDIVRRRWREESRVLGQFRQEMLFDETFKLALRQGEASALQRVFLFLDDPAFKDSVGGWHLAQALWPGVRLSGLDPEKRQDNEAVLAWMRTHRPEDFVFDPARRQFVLKENLAAREPAAAPKP